jgi:hypothetical protein
MPNITLKMSECENSAAMFPAARVDSFVCPVAFMLEAVWSLDIVTLICSA